MLYYTLKRLGYSGMVVSWKVSSNKVCVPNKTGDLNLSVSNIITGINESKTLTKHVSCKCKYKFDGRKCK